MKSFLKRYWLWVIVILFFIVWNGFLSKSSWLNITSVKNQISQLESQKEEYRSHIIEDSTFIEHLKEPLFLERFAREKLNMVRPGEELYIIEYDTIDNKRSKP